MDEEGNLKLPEDFIGFQNANASPFPSEAFFYDYGYGDIGGGKWLDFGVPFGNPARDHWDAGDFYENPNMRPIKTEFIFKISAGGAAHLGVAGGDLFLVGCKFMNNPEAVKNGARPFGIMNMLIPGPALRELIGKGYFKEGGFFMPAIKGESLNEEFPGPFKVLLHGNLYNKQGFRQKDIENMLLAVEKEDVVDENLQRVILLADYIHNLWNGPIPWFYLGR
jgi:hypothetical protein